MRSRSASGLGMAPDRSERDAHWVTIGPVSTASKSLPLICESVARLVSFQLGSGAPRLTSSSRCRRRTCRILERREDHLDLGRELRDVDARLEAQAKAHGRDVRARVAARVVGRGSNVPCCEVWTVKRSAWLIAPFVTASSKRASPGKIGRPAASAEVQPAGRRLFEVRSKTAPPLQLQLLFAPG